MVCTQKVEFRKAELEPATPQTLAKPQKIEEIEEIEVHH